MLAKPFIDAPWTLLPAAFMLLAALLAARHAMPVERLWRSFLALSGLALLAATGAALAAFAKATPAGSLPLTGVMAVLVQLLGTVIGAFSARYLDAEPHQRRYVAALACVLAAVHVLLWADHWIVLIAAWSLAGVALQHLLCFYPDRPFALLAAHKKRIADRAADALLVAAAALAWAASGSGTLSGLWDHVAREGLSPALHASAVLLSLAVILRTALLPAHGWIIQVMEAPTPVSALLHAGVVNLGGFVLIRFAPLLEHATVARWMLLTVGLVTAALAGLVMLTRVTIKVRLAWSTVAQMGFMVLECGLGLYTLAALHLIGHSLYKAHAFLAASSVVQDTRIRMMRGALAYRPVSLLLAPLAAAIVVHAVATAGAASWPAWWTAALALAFAPLLWWPASATTPRAALSRFVVGCALAAGFTAACLLAHAVPLGVRDAPDALLGWVALLGLAGLYAGQAIVQWHPRALEAWRRWSYAGFYVDEFYTRLALRLWPGRWTAASRAPVAPAPVRAVAAAGDAD